MSSMSGYLTSQNLLPSLARSGRGMGSRPACSCGPIDPPKPNRPWTHAVLFPEGAPDITTRTKPERRNPTQTPLDASAQRPAITLHHNRHNCVNGLLTHYTLAC